MDFFRFWRTVLFAIIFAVEVSVCTSLAYCVWPSLCWVVLIGYNSWPL